MRAQTGTIASGNVGEQQLGDDDVDGDDEEVRCSLSLKCMCMNHPLLSNQKFRSFVLILSVACDPW